MLEIILKKGFCPLKNKITLFPNFHFNIITSKCTSSHVFMSYMSNQTKSFFLFFEKSVNLLNGNMAKMKSLLIGYKRKWTLALFILLIFIKLVSVHKGAKKEKTEKELGQHPALGQ